MKVAEQLPLQFEYRGNQKFATFYPGRNQEIITHLKACTDHSGEQFLYIWGARGQGKSHLLQACCHQAFERNHQAFYLAPNLDKLPEASILDGLEAMDLVCIDDIDQFLDQANWEQALFNFFNRLRDNNKRLIVASQYSPTQIPVQLSDLKTRLSWGLTLKLQALDDAELIGALQLRANTMGFEISEKSGRFLLTHYTRDSIALWNLLHRLDHATLAAQRKVTIPFLKQLLAL